MGVLIGIDPHKKKSVNAAAAIDEQGELAGHETFPTNRKGLRALQRWAKRFPEASLGGGGSRRYRPSRGSAARHGGREGSGCPAQTLLESQASLYSKRPQQRPSGRDIHRSGRPAQRAAGPSTIRGRRRRSRRGSQAAHGEALIDLVAERTRALNRLHVLLCGTFSATPSASSSAPMPPPGCCGESDHGTNQREPESEWPPR
jgi:hypothetical protein